MKKNFSIEKGVITLRVNRNIYTKEIIVQTCYVMLEKFYFLIDEEGDSYHVEMKPKEKRDAKEEDAYSFFDELIESQSYLDQLKRTSEIRQTILERALLTQYVDEKKEE